MKTPSILTLCAAATVLAACGGGSSSSIDYGGGASGDDLQVLTGSQPPLETPYYQAARTAGIISRSDSLILSSGYGNTSHPAIPSFTVRSTCSGTTCVLREPSTGWLDTVSINDLEVRPGTVTIAHSKHGITLFGGEGDGFKGLGSWMRHSAFQIGEERGTYDGIKLEARYGLAGGDLAGSHPASSATWRGLMVGTPVNGSDRGDFLQGDATLVYGFSGTLAANFADIKNLDKKRDHAVPAVLFANVPVNADGAFQAGVTGNRIQGGFFGSGHAETVGVFEQAGIVGAFGGSRD